MSGNLRLHFRAVDAGLLHSLLHFTQCIFGYTRHSQARLPLLSLARKFTRISYTSHVPPSHRGCSRLHSKPPALSLNTMSGREDILLRAHRHTSSLHITHPTTPLHYTHEAHEGRGQCIGYGECVKATSPPLAGSLRWQRLTPVPQHTSEASSPGTYPFRRYRSTASPCSPLRDEQ